MVGRAPRARGCRAGSHLRRGSPKVLGSVAPSLRIESLLLSAVGGLRPRTRGRGCTAAPDSGGRGEGRPHLARGPHVGLGGHSAPRLCASSHGLKSWKTKPRPEPAGTESGAGCICSHSNSSGVFVEKSQKWRFESQHLGGPHPGGSSPHTGGSAGIPTPHPAHLTSLPCTCEQQGAESMEGDVEEVVSFHHTNSGGYLQILSRGPALWTVG